MDDNQDPSPQDNRPQPENETQRLHRLVIPMILDILRSRGARRQSSRSRSQDHPEETLWNSLNSMHDDPPPLVDTTSDHPPSLPSDTPASDDMLIDEADNVNRSTNENLHSNSTDLAQEAAPMTDQQGQLIPSPTETPSTTPRRPRYRLVVYFEERDMLNDAAGEDTEVENAPREDSHRPSRYVAIFSIDSDAQNMPIIHSAGLQQSPANFDDILNQLFSSYMPKGTPPAKKEIIDALPTATFSHETCATQPKCAVCLEHFEEGAEVVVLPCSHRFHGEECVKPWLRMHSSCPICRYEMPVDDAEYEEKRKERMAKRIIPAPEDATLQDVVVDEPSLL